MEPTVQRVAEAVQEMVARPWPHTDDELDAWVRWHHLTALPGADGALSGPGGTTGHLKRHDGRFAGVDLHLWPLLDPIEQINRVRGLSAAFTTLCGEPEDEWGATGSPAAAWRTPTRVIQLFAHTGARAGVHLHVAEAELADTQEAEARARREAETHPLAALGAPLDSASFTAAQQQTHDLTEGTKRPTSPPT